jgi:hypothetical protein
MVTFLRGDKNFARVRLKKAHDLLQGNRFTDTRTPENAECFARAYREADIVEHMQIAE